MLADTVYVKCENLQRAGAGTQQHADIIESANASPDCQWHEANLGCASHDVEHDVALLVTGSDVEEHQFIRTVLFILSGNLHGIPGIAQVEKVHPLDDPSGMNIKAWNNSFGKHETGFGRGTA